MKFEPGKISSLSAYVTLQDDGTLVIPQLRIGADYFSAALKREETAGLTPEFVLQNIEKVTNEHDVDHANFYPATGIAEISSFLSGLSTYALTLKATDATQQRFKIQHLSPRDEVTWLYMISGSSVISFQAEGTYGDITVGKHFALDVKANIEH